MDNIIELNVVIYTVGKLVWATQIEMQTLDWKLCKNDG